MPESLHFQRFQNFQRDFVPSFGIEQANPDFLGMFGK